MRRAPRRRQQGGKSIPGAAGIVGAPAPTRRLVAERAPSLHTCRACCEAEDRVGLAWLGGGAVSASGAADVPDLAQWTRDYCCLVDWAAADFRDPQKPRLIRQLHVERWLIGSPR